MTLYWIIIILYSGLACSSLMILPSRTFAKTWIILWPICMRLEAWSAVFSCAPGVEAWKPGFQRSRRPRVVALDGHKWGQLPVSPPPVVTNTCSVSHPDLLFLTMQPFSFFAASFKFNHSFKTTTFPTGTNLSFSHRYLSFFPQVLILFSTGTNFLFPQVLTFLFPTGINHFFCYSGGAGVRISFNLGFKLW